MEINPLVLVVQIVVFLYSVIFHEIAHGWVANHFGDDTARVSGRLSFNPIVHIDPIGSIIVPLMLFISSAGILFGWAKPVPVNPYRLKGGKMSYRWVTLAGVLTNFSLAIIAGIILKITTQYLGFAPDNLGVIFFLFLLQINIILGVFNSLPLPGFDGFNFLTTFDGFATLVSKTPLANPMFMVRYGLTISIILLFLFMPVISVIFQFVFGLFITILGL